MPKCWNQEDTAWRFEKTYLPGDATSLSLAPSLFLTNQKFSLPWFQVMQPNGCNQNCTADVLLLFKAT